MEQAMSRALPAEMGVDPKAILSLLDLIEKEKLGLHGLTILRHGKIIAEGWWEPYGPEQVHMLFSLSKSFTSTAIGFAVQEGLLSLSDKLASFFPELLKAPPCPGMETLCLRDMLRMSTGHTAEPPLDSKDGDWRKTFLTSYLELEPGSRFLYNTAATYMLSAVIQKVTGLQTGEYLRPRLFEPLGIRDWWWEVCPQGIHTGGFGLNLRTSDLAKFGQFLLQRGMWEGRQLLNPEWIDEASSLQAQNFGEKDWGAGYGYQFWRCTQEDVYRGDGAFGQLCVICPRQDMVIAVNAGVNDIQQELSAFWDVLLPGVAEEPLPADPQAQAELERRLAALRFAPPEGMASCETAQQISGTVYELSDNKLGIERLSLTFGDAPSLTLTVKGEEQHFPIGYGAWLTTDNGLSREKYPRTSCAGAWKGGAYLLDLIHSSTPFMEHWKLEFDENALILTITCTLTWDGPMVTRLIGRCV